MLELEELLEYAEELKDDDSAKLSLYFVTRHLKSGMNKNSKVTDKYDFKLVQAAISSSIKSFFQKTLANQIISHGSRDDIEMKNYTVIDDDINNKIYAYADNNAISFSKVINEQIKDPNIPELNALNDIRNDLWAYCIKVEQNKKFTYSFRKISSGKVTTNATDEVKGFFNKLSAGFDKTGKELKEFDGSVINFDDKIDCIYIEDKFYVFHKKSFESIVGLEAEFTEAAQKTLNKIKEFELVEGLEHIESAMLHKPSLRKTLAHIAEKGNHTSLDEQEIVSMNEVLNKFKGESFEMKEGKIVINNEAEGKNFLRLLNDYYKQGMTTKKYYATDSGSLVNPAN
ncbi:Kiwa anti-phage protein KwaB-like domain-containing protein [Vibrio alginolyticus]|uniref:Kiwa anti-phage protein KwaB-like domain-containing protein n=1 Tax=Vibrio alginolyticus TaxID=663 RepID=UPI003218C006